MSFGSNNHPYQLSWLFDKCVNADKQYIHVEEDGSYLLQREGDVLFLLLQKSNGDKDWKNNFDFPAKPYKDMPITWKAHRGFVRVWKAIEPYVEEAVKDPTVKSIITIGYSHGAALAALAQEYVWFNRPDIRDDCYSFAFEPPRVFCGCRIPDGLKERWANHLVVRTANDLVTHVPPALFGYKHVGTMLHLPLTVETGMVRYKSFDCINAHYAANVKTAIKNYEKNF